MAIRVDGIYLHKFLGMIIVTWRSYAFSTSDEFGSLYFDKILGNVGDFAIWKASVGLIQILPIRMTG